MRLLKHYEVRKKGKNTIERLISPCLVRQVNKDVKATAGILHNPISMGVRRYKCP